MSTPARLDVEFRPRRGRRDIASPTRRHSAPGAHESDDKRGPLIVIAKIVVHLVHDEGGEFVLAIDRPRADEPLREVGSSRACVSLSLL